MHLLGHIRMYHECEGWIEKSVPRIAVCHQEVCRVMTKGNECEGRIEKSVSRIAVWHHEACRVMTNGDPEGWIFLSYPHTNNGFFFLLTAVFIYFFYFLSICFKISFQKSLNMLRCNFI